MNLLKKLENTGVVNVENLLCTQILKKILYLILSFIWAVHWHCKFQKSLCGTALNSTLVIFSIRSSNHLFMWPPGWARISRLPATFCNQLSLWLMSIKLLICYALNWIQKGICAW